MTTLPPPGVNLFPESSVEKQCYNIVELFKENIPVMNDRNRLGYNLVKFVQGEGDKPEILLNSAKIKVVGISKEELANKISAELSKINS